MWLTKFCQANFRRGSLSRCSMTLRLFIKTEWINKSIKHFFGDFPWATTSADQHARVELFIVWTAFFTSCHKQSLTFHPISVWLSFSHPLQLHHPCLKCLWMSQKLERAFVPPPFICYQADKWLAPDPYQARNFPRSPRKRRPLWE